MNSRSKQQPVHTFHALAHWHKHEVEKLGWMLIDHGKGRESKIAEYKRTLRYLLDALAQKIEMTHDADKVQDLQIMHYNVGVLSRYVDRVLA